MPARTNDYDATARRQSLTTNEGAWSNTSTGRPTRSVAVDAPGASSPSNTPFTPPRVIPNNRGVVNGVDSATLYERHPTQHIPAINNHVNGVQSSRLRGLQSAQYTPAGSGPSVHVNMNDTRNQVNRVRSTAVYASPPPSQSDLNRQSSRSSRSHVLDSHPSSSSSSAITPQDYFPPSATRPRRNTVRVFGFNPEPVVPSQNNAHSPGVPVPQYGSAPPVGATVPRRGRSTGEAPRFRSLLTLSLDRHAGYTPAQAPQESPTSRPGSALGWQQSGYTHEQASSASPPVSVQPPHRQNFQIQYAPVPRGVVGTGPLAHYRISPQRLDQDDSSGFDQSGPLPPVYEDGSVGDEASSSSSRTRHGRR